MRLFYANPFDSPLGDKTQQAHLRNIYPISFCLNSTVNTSAFSFSFEGGTVFKGSDDALESSA